MNPQSKPIITTMEEPTQIKGGAELAIIVNTHVDELEIPITPKPISLAMPQIGVGVEVILIDIITHAFEVFKTLEAVPRDTCY